MSAAGLRAARTALKALNTQRDALLTSGDPAGKRVAHIAGELARQGFTAGTIGRQLQPGVALQGFRAAEPWLGVPAEADVEELLDDPFAQPDVPRTFLMPWGRVAAATHLHCVLLWMLANVVADDGVPVRQAMAEAVRFVNSCLTSRHGGHSIELRVPPVSAVQLAAIGEAPSHTRGTPGSVVETDATTWFRIAIGRADFCAEQAAGRLSVSGSHAGDVALMLPVVDFAAAR